jgi:hypothetical protein
LEPVDTVFTGIGLLNAGNGLRIAGLVEVEARDTGTGGLGTGFAGIGVRTNCGGGEVGSATGQAGTTLISSVEVVVLDAACFASVMIGFGFVERGSVEVAGIGLTEVHLLVVDAALAVGAGRFVLVVGNVDFGGKGLIVVNPIFADCGA